MFSKIHVDNQVYVTDDQLNENFQSHKIYMVSFPLKWSSLYPVYRR